MMCPNCKRRLKADAIGCLCGWSIATTKPSVARVPCCFDGCPEAALCRLWTKSGWANVCVNHYGKVETVPRRCENLLCREIRAAYEKSQMYQKKNGTPAPKLPERIPGSDDEPEMGTNVPALGIPLDALEQELMEAANP